MAFTQADIDAIDRRIATARKRVASGDKSIDEFAIAELIQARDHAARVLANSNAAVAPRTMRSFARFCRRL